MDVLVITACLLVYNYRGTYYNQESINALVECAYLHGVDVLGASLYVYFESDASNCLRLGWWTRGLNAAPNQHGLSQNRSLVP